MNEGQAIGWLLYVAFCTGASACVIGMCNGIGQWVAMYFLAMCCVAAGLHCSNLTDPTILVLLLAALPIVLHLTGEKVWD